MRPIRKLIAAGAAIAALLPAVGQAETLTDTLVDAYKNSQILDQNRALLRAADEDVAITLSRLRPVLDYVAQAGYSDTRGLDGYQGSVGLAAQMLLYDFGATRLTVDSSQEIVLATREALRDVEQRILLSAVSAYLAVREQVQNVELNRNSVSLITEQLRAAQDRFDVGEVTRTDVAQAEARLARANSDLAQARAGLEIAREQFILAVGRAPGTLEAPPPPPRIPQSLSEAKSIALDRHPLLLQAQRNVRATELTTESLQRAIYPSLNATVGLDRVFRDNAQDTNDASVGLSLRGPIYSGGLISAQFRQSLARTEQARSTLKQTALERVDEAGRAWATLQGANAAFVAAQQEVSAQQIAFEGVREEARLGARTTLDVLDSEQDLLTARTTSVRARIAADEAIYALLSSVGLLTVDYLGLNVPTYDVTAYYNAVKDAPATSTQGEALDRVLRSISRP